MAELRPQQRDLLDLLEASNAPRHGVIQAPAGVGVRRVISLFLSQDPTRNVLIATHSLSLVEAWLDRLMADGVITRAITSAHDALLIEEDDQESAGVFVTTFAQLRHGPSARFLEHEAFDLVVLDGPPIGVSVQPELKALLERSRRSLTLESTPVTARMDLAWSSAPILFRLSLEDALASGQLNVREIPFKLQDDERSLVRDAAHLLAVPRWMDPEIEGPPSRPLLHSKLLQVATRSTTHEGGSSSWVQARAWELIERLEDLDSDPRMSALEPLLLRSRETNHVHIVITSSPIEADYVHQALSQSLPREISLVTGTTPREQRQRAIRSVGASGVLVGSRAILDLLDRVPRQAEVVWWSNTPPQDVLRQVAQFAGGRAVYQLRAHL